MFRVKSTLSIIAKGETIGEKFVGFSAVKIMKVTLRN